jgi:hypothetical protein
MVVIYNCNKIWDAGSLQAGFRWVYMVPTVFFKQDSISGLYYKSFMIVIYYRNDSSQYFKSMIMILSFAPSFA